MAKAKEAVVTIAPIIKSGSVSKMKGTLRGVFGKVGGLLSKSATDLQGGMGEASRLLSGMNGTGFAIAGSIVAAATAAALIISSQAKKGLATLEKKDDLFSQMDSVSDFANMLEIDTGELEMVIGGFSTNASQEATMSAFEKFEKNARTTGVDIHGQTDAEGNILTPLEVFRSRLEEMAEATGEKRSALALEHFGGKMYKELNDVMLGAVEVRKQEDSGASFEASYHRSENTIRALRESYAKGDEHASKKGYIADQERIKQQLEASNNDGSKYALQHFQNQKSEELYKLKNLNAGVAEASLRWETAKIALGDGMDKILSEGMSSLNKALSVTTDIIGGMGSMMKRFGGFIGDLVVGGDLPKNPATNSREQL